MPRPSVQPRKIRKPGLIRDAIVQVLTNASVPMRAWEIHQAVEARLGEAVSRSTVKNCLVDNAQPHGCLRRVGYGRYALR